MNDPQVLVTNSANPTGVWIDLTECRNEEEFNSKCQVELGLPLNYEIHDSADLPLCFIRDHELFSEAFEFAQKDEEDRTVIFAYSTISTDIAHYIERNALAAWRYTSGSREEFAQAFVANQGFNIPPLIRDCIAYEKLVKKLEDDYIFVDIASKTYVFIK